MTPEDRHKQFVALNNLAADMAQISARRERAVWLSENCSKPANATNGTSFSEMMAHLGAQR